MYTRIYDGSLLFVEGCLIGISMNMTSHKRCIFFFFWRRERQFLLSREEKRIIYMELLEVMYKPIGIMDSTFLKIVCKYWGTINLCYWLWTMVNKYKKYRSQPSKYNIDTYEYWSNNYTFESRMKSYWFYSTKGMQTIDSSYSIFFYYCY